MKALLIIAISCILILFCVGFNISKNLNLILQLQQLPFSKRKVRHKSDFIHCCDWVKMA